MEYVMVKISFLGNDDINFQGFKICEVESKKEWEKQIKNNIQQELDDGGGYFTIYSSDNAGTPFESLEEVWNTLTFKKITQEEFKAVSNVLGVKGKNVEYGHTPDFLDYVEPKPKAKLTKK